MIFFFVLQALFGQCLAGEVVPAGSDGSAKLGGCCCCCSAHLTEWDYFYFLFILFFFPVVLETFWKCFGAVIRPWK